MISYSKLKLFKSLMLTACASALCGHTVLTAASEQVWQDYAASPYTHLNIPNNSHAGYRGGKAAIPDVPVVVNLLDFGGNGDGVADNTQAFQSAIEAAWLAGGGAVYIPAGTYLVDKMIHLNKSGVVLRGAGADETTLLFPNDMNHAAGNFIDSNGNTHWFWQGGLLWMGPAAQLRRDFRQNFVHEGVSMGIDTGVWWPETPSNAGFVGKRVASVSGLHAEGSFTVDVADASALQEGMYYRMVYKNAASTGDYDLYKEMVGHPLMQNNFPWAGAGALHARTQWVWPVRIAKIDGNHVTLDQPLRLQTLAKWEVGFETMGEVIYESGIEDLRVELTSSVDLPDSHTHDVKHNAIYLTKTINCWVRNVDIVNAQNGILTRATKNIELRDFRLLGHIRLHHGVSVVRGHDNLITNFTMDPRIGHGISIEDLASGNVFSKGDMGLGTASGGGSFDSHRYMSFDTMRTDIYVLNSIGRPGGNNNTGPLNGRRVVHWNIRGNTGDNLGDYVNMPDAHSHGALVGVQGIKSLAAAWAMVPGDKGNIIADEGIVPVYPDLFEKQVEHRHATEAWVELESPHLDLITPALTTLTANAIPGAGVVESVTFYVDGAPYDVATAEPFSVAWTPEKGQYAVHLVMQTNLATVTSPVRTITVGQREVIEDSDTRLTYAGPKTVFNNSTASGGTYTQMRADQLASTTLNFRGTRFIVVVQNIQATQQKLNIYINDLTNPVELVSPARISEPRFVAYDSGPLPDGDYTVKIEPPTHAVLLDYILIENTGEFVGAEPGIPSDPTNLVAQAITPSQINLTWMDQSNNETGFKIERSLTGVDSWVQIAVVPANTTSYSNVGLTGSVQYHYRVRAYNADGDSEYTSVANATTPAPASVPVAPSDLAAVAVAYNRVDLTWSMSGDTHEGFDIERSTDGGSWTFAATVGPAVSNWSDLGLVAETHYAYRISAYNSAGASDPSETAAATTPQQPSSSGSVEPVSWFIQALDDTGSITTNLPGHVVFTGVSIRQYRGAVAALNQATTLEQEGDFMQLTFESEFPNMGNNEPFAVRVGLFNDNGNPVISDFSDVSDGSVGFFAALSNRNSNGRASDLYVQGPGTSPILARGINTATLAVQGNTRVATASLANFGNRSVTMVITRLAEGALRFSVESIDETDNLLTLTSDIPAGSVPTYTINQIAVSAGYQGIVGQGYKDIVIQIGGPSFAETGEQTFAAWRSSQFSEAELADENISGAMADPTGQGLSNLERYAFGLSSTASSASAVPLLVHAKEETQTSLGLSFLRNTEATDVTMTLQASTDLVNWDFLDDVTLQQAPSEPTEQEHIVRDVWYFSFPSQDLQITPVFLRLQVTVP